MDVFFNWFERHGGAIDRAAMKIGEIPGCARGAIALQDLPEGHTLFTIPRDLTLSTRTSALPSKLGLSTWKQYGLHVGWAGLILCMMWEEAQGAESKWDGYMSILPSEFDTPMFWSEAELDELKGTSVVDKIGEADAEKDFHDKVLPVIQSRSDLFPSEAIIQYYTLERYHVMGSRVLSRSFQVSKWEGEAEDQDNVPTEANTSVDSAAMDVDASPSPSEHKEDHDEDDEDDNEDNPADVAMVPMADMLNARYESENAKLFYEEHNLKMITTKAIMAGEQIWNTYGDPPNSDLVRRYGHVDLLPLQPPLSGSGNMADNVEIRADLVVHAVSKLKGNLAVHQERIDWWLEEAEDDTFVVFTDCDLPQELISLTRLLLQSEAEWIKTQTKGKLPKPMVDSDLLSVAIEVLQSRLAEYPTSVQEDEALLADGTLSTNVRNAVVVRLGEKRILAGTIAGARSQLERSQASDSSKGNSKRKRAEQEQAKSKRDKKARQ
ncbi:SET domain-containing protein [Irpex rosettiformis]|uniref:SET domain-containing protein n=1 Tax=Irpex rosettiformis TaxID=378272 RepID=A0ACB8U1C9_9APHY|nr:SET domain-containing protein [Irpex rosettiformis]